MSGVERFHVVTGGPGSGKTTLVDALAQAGYARTVEAGREDAERRQTAGEAERTYEALVAAYASCGYELVSLPRTAVEDRMRFVHDAIGA